MKRSSAPPFAGIMQIWLNIQSGMEETKERFRDAESEIKAARQG